MSYDNANQVIAKQVMGHNTEKILYDAVGRPVSEQTEGGGTLRRLNYEYGDKIVGSSKQDSKASFYYNAEGQLCGKNTSGHVTSYAWDGNVLAADDKDVFTNESHISGGVPVLFSGKEILVSDYLGNTLAAEGKLFESTAFGEGLEEGRFTGKPYVKELGGFVFAHRIYVPNIAHWNSTDPLGFPDGTNRYAYLADPNSGVDPMGTTVKLWIAGAPKPSHWVSSDGDGDQYGFEKWNYLYSWSAYGGNSAHGTDAGLKFLIYADGQAGNTKTFEINENIEVFEDMSTGLLDVSETGLYEENDSPCVAGVAATVTGIGTKTLNAKATMKIGHQATGIAGGGVNGPVSFSITGTATNDQRSYKLGTWVWKES